MQKFRLKLYTALALTFVPPAVVAGLYLYGSSTGCSGGDCTGPMMGVMFLGVAAVPVTLLGAVCLVGVLVGALFEKVGARFRRPLS